MWVVVEGVVWVEVEGVVWVEVVWVEVEGVVWVEVVWVEVVWVEVEVAWLGTMLPIDGVLLRSVLLFLRLR